MKHRVDRRTPQELDALNRENQRDYEAWQMWQGRLKAFKAKADHMPELSGQYYLGVVDAIENHPIILEKIGFPEEMPACERRELMKHFSYLIEYRPK